MNRTDVDALARLLDGDPSLNGEVTATTRALAQTAHTLSSRSVRPALDPAAKARLRAEVVHAARAWTAAPPLLTRWRAIIDAVVARWRYSSRVAAATGATALALSSGGVAVAAEQAMPSDTLYSTKLVLEDVRMAFVRDEAARGQRHLQQAIERITEAEMAATAGDHDGAAVALRNADASAREGAASLIRSYQDDGNPAHVRQLATFTDEQRARLMGLRTMLAGDAAEAAQVLFTALARIEVRMLTVTGTCDSCVGMPAAGVDFDFATIPPADQHFEACPCRVPARGENPSASDDAGAGEPDEGEQEPPVEQLPADRQPGVVGSPDGPPPRERPDSEVNPPRERPSVPDSSLPGALVPSAPEHRPESGSQAPLHDERSGLDDTIRDVLDGLGLE